MITRAQFDSYHELGYLVVPGVITQSEIISLRCATDAMVEDARAVTANDTLYDLEDDHSPRGPRVRRLKDPDRFNDAFRAMVGHRDIVEILGRLWGNAVRYDKSKLNMKSGAGGAAVEWHQDWAFYPHTNDDLAAVGIMIDDMTEDNGPLMVLPGSHRGPVYEHFADGVFCGAIDVEQAGLDLGEARALTGEAGSITIHHVRTVHGSAPNRSASERRLLLHQYTAADAWPLLGVPDYDAFRARLCSGEESKRPRIKPAPVIMPFPQAASQGSIYENQRALEHRYFSEDAPRNTALAT